MSMESQIPNGESPNLDDSKRQCVIRSLRRRLWRAFQQDDAEAALKAYEATYADFDKMISAEEAEKEKIETESESNSKSPSVSRRKSHNDLNGSRHRSNSRGKSSTHRSNSRGKTGRHRSNSRGKSGRRRSSLEQPSLEFSDIMMSTSDIHQSTRSILQACMNPSEPFIADDFLGPYASYDKPAQKKIPDVKKEKEKRRVRKQQRPRAAFNIFSYRKDLNNEPDIIAPETMDNTGVEEEDLNMTTPLHEASRLGSGALMRVLLANGGDASVKDGKQRTSLHVACGGVTKDEHRMIVSINRPKDKEIAREAGIRAPVIAKEVMDLMNAEAESSDKKRRGKKGVKKFKAVGMLLMRNSSQNKGSHADDDKGASRQRRTRLDKQRVKELAVERIDAAFTLLMWSHKATGAGVSLNAVDDLGRSALHYAAEMGRPEICSAIMENFQTMFTIVDEIGSRTPCECAARLGHKDLAAQLEARAILYIDPSGLDDELMASVETPYTDDEDGNALAPPYNWFKTLTSKEAATERERRIDSGRERMWTAIQEWEANPKQKTRLDRSNHGSDDDEDMSQEELKERREASRGDAKGLDFAIAENGEAPDFNRIQDAHIERFFAYHRWDTYEAVDAFKKNPEKAFEKAQIQIPSAPDESKSSDERSCPICFDDITNDENWMKFDGCRHAFCTDCLEFYVMDAAKSMTPISKIMCPQHGCQGSIGKQCVNRLMKDHPETCIRIEEATVRHFVSSSYDHKFCHAPGCTGVVKKVPQRMFTIAGYDPDLHDYCAAVCTSGPKNRCPPGSTPTLTYDGVEDSKYNSCRSKTQPQRAHRFCFKCGESMHWPVPCDKLKEWKKKMREEIGELEEEETTANADELAMKIWIKANTKACPQCNNFIEKNDGCNHMTCVYPSCRYEFCWICLRDWKSHGSATGGFFRCNIWKEEDDGSNPAPPPAAENGDGDEGFGTAIHSSKQQYRKRQEINRFLHHYTRYEAHDQSARLERNMAESATNRLAPVVAAAIDYDGSPAFNFGGKGLSFIHSAFTELLECRSTLKYSYAYSFFRYPTFFHFRLIHELNLIRKEKVVFEKYQADLEVITEQMSDVLARSHIRASQVQISFLTAGAAEKRIDFSKLLFHVLHSERGKERRRREGQPLARTHLTEYTDYWSDDYESASQDGYDSRDEGEIVEWTCSICTFINISVPNCEMCGAQRPPSTM